MTVKLLSTIQNYGGLSDDAKPTDGVKNGSVFFERDTELRYKFADGVWYVERAAAVETEQSRIDVKDILEQMNETLQTIAEKL